MKKLYRNYIIKCIIVASIVCVDLLTKNLFFGKSFVVIPYLIGVRSVQTLNTGGAWGFLGSHLPLLIAFTILFLALVVFVELKWKNTSKLYTLAITFIVGGAIGNFIDRIFLGGVRDFVYFPFAENFPSFNVADSFLCIGMVLLAIYVIFFYKKGENDVKAK